MLSHSIVVEKVQICFQQMFFFAICEIFTSHLSRFCSQGANNNFAFDIGYSHYTTCPPFPPK